jgi:hypothetical protein
MPSNRPVSRCVRRGRLLAFSPLALLAILLSLPMPAKAEGPPGPKEKIAPPKDPQKEKWQCLFDGRSLGKWKVIDELDYSRHGKVYVRDGRIVLEAGRPATGIKWTGPFPKIDYELTFEAMRVEGSDFFAAVTFPVGDAALTLVVGGWGGSTVGLSKIDGEMAIDNETCLSREFDQKRWYRIRLRVIKPRIEAWIDDDQVVDLATEGRKFTVSWEMEPPLPFGIATWRTTGAVRDVRVRPIGPKGERR